MADDGRAYERRQPDRQAAETPGPQPRPENPDQAGDVNPYRVAPSPAGAGQAQPTPPPQPPGWTPPQDHPGYPGPNPYGYGPYPYPGPYGAAQPAPYQGQQPYGYGPPAYGPQSPYQAPYPSGYGPSSPPRPQTESLAVLALVLAIVAVLLMPIVPALAAYVVAARARSSITASYGARGGLGMVSAARWIATIHLLLVIPGSILFGVALFPLGWLV